MKPLDATVEQNGAFWVRMDTKEYKGFTPGNLLCLKWTGSNIETTSCGAQLSVVCQKEL